METFVTSLRNETHEHLREILARRIANQDKAWSAICFLEQDVAKLAEFTINYSFRDEAEEIAFFKWQKPEIISWLMYGYDVFLSETGRPSGSNEAIIEYLKSELDCMRRFYDCHIGFIRYWRGGGTHMDREYFTRGTLNGVDRILCESCWHGRDPRFTTSGDLTVARIMAYELFAGYIKNELRKIEYPELSELSENPPVWTGSKTELIEQLYSWDSYECFNDGKLPLTQLSAYIERAFGIKLDNISQSFNEMKTGILRRLFSTG